MRSTIISGSIAMALAIHAAHADDSVDDRLAKTTIFAFGGVGFGGSTSEGELAFREVWKQPDAARHFRLIFLDAKATPEARCYALAALQSLAPVEFKDCADQFRSKPPKTVHTMSGCEMSRENGLDVLVRIEAGSFVRFLPGKTN